MHVIACSISIELDRLVNPEKLVRDFEKSGSGLVLVSTNSVLKTNMSVTGNDFEQTHQLSYFSSGKFLLINVTGTRICITSFSHSLETLTLARSLTIG